MLRYKIYYDGKYLDEIIIEGETIEEIRAIATEELNKRCWDKNNCWSEPIQ
jgi:hypothetical protein